MTGGLGDAEGSDILQLTNGWQEGGAYSAAFNFMLRENFKPKFTWCAIQAKKTAVGLHEAFQADTPAISGRKSAGNRVRLPGRATF